MAQAPRAGRGGARRAGPPAAGAGAADTRSAPGRGGRAGAGSRPGGHAGGTPRRAGQRIRPSALEFHPSRTRPHGAILIEPKTLACLAARIADEKKGQDIQVIDVRERLRVVDYFVIATATSRPQVRAIQNEVHVRLKALGETHLPIEGADLGWWVLLDYVDVVVHVMQPEARAYYELEQLYGDSERVDWRAVDVPAHAAGN
ncbi:MAG: ribosome silencing factor [Planctomycetes bacterium]|nr:ribosome silencing factor [Planctomycetota bacterium]